MRNDDLPLRGLLFAWAAIAASCAPAARAAQNDAVAVSGTPAAATIENALVRVEYDLARGTYAAIDRRDGSVCIRGACARVNDLASNQAGWRHRYDSRPAAGAPGAKTLVIKSTQEAKPSLILEITLYPGKGFVVLGAGVENAAEKEIQVKEICPLSGAEAFPGARPRSDVRTLNGPGGAGQTRVAGDPQGAGVFRTSPNNLLLTFRAAEKRYSLVMGGLTYHEFLKFASVGGSIQQLRRATLKSLLPGECRLAAYVDCGVAAGDGAKGGPTLRLVAGEPYTWPGADAAADACFASVAFDAKEVVFEAAGLDERKSYVLGFSWWDYDNNGRVQSVVIEADAKRRTLLAGKPLPAHADKGAPPQEWALAIPRDAWASGKMKIAFTKDASVPNACVSEVWLWEGTDISVPGDLAAGKGVAPASAPADPDAGIAVELKAADPVGKQVAPSGQYVPDDRFYVDFTTADPFAALEQYGLALREAQQVKPHIYDFPTVCAWYVGLFDYPQADNRPEKSKYGIAASPGLVEEMRKAAETGFLKYSRLAMRLVPDKYAGTEPKGFTQQGWWDDEHWARLGHYAAPCETTAKYGEAIRRLGGLPFTYFQLIFESGDFRQAFPNMLLGKDPRRTLDYSSPAAQAHMRKVYANLRAGGIAGMMFDYADGVWSGQLVRGGFEDKHATAAGVYRTIFALAKEGLGEDSWIHERVLGDPNSDIAAGVVDSQRVWGDTSAITPEMASRCGLRWYKNRVIFSYDMDAKNLLHGWKRPNFNAADRDGRRMMLTMAYVAASRLLLATSYRDMSSEVLYDLERTFPYHAAPKSARPVDMLVCRGWPKVYDFAVSPRWHQVTFFNNDDPAREAEIGADLGGDAALGALGLDPAKDYYVYDFWNEKLVGRLKGSERLKQTLRPGEARMLSVHEAEPNPQFLSTNRHLMQGYVDMPGAPKWDAWHLRLCGTSRVVGGETYKVVLASNGYRPAGASAGAAKARVETAGGEGLAVLSIDSPKNADVEWTVTFEK